MSDENDNEKKEPRKITIPVNSNRGHTERDGYDKARRP